jgi:hypothetical protein
MNPTTPQRRETIVTASNQFLLWYLFCRKYPIEYALESKEKESTQAEDD